MEIRILYEDESLLAVDKPANLVVHQTLDPSRPHLLKSLESEKKELFLINRLDKETSGIVLIAKDIESASLYSKIFSEREVEKIYLAIVEGEIEFSAKNISNYLGPVNGLKNIYRSVKSGGKQAETFFRKIFATSSFSLIEAIPKTGRTHQIRVHLTELGFPIAGDIDYGAPFRHEFKRTMLHASSVSFLHPKTKKKISISSPLPEDFKKSLAILGLQNS